MELRPALPADAAGILAIYRPMVDGTAVSFELDCPSLDVMTARLQDNDYPWIVCVDGGTVIGYAHASRHRSRGAYRWAAEVSVYVGEVYRRLGIGARLYRTLFEILRLMGYRTVLAGIALPNEPSIAIHESLGFVPTATYRGIGYKLGRWRDVGWWQLDIGSRDSEPAPPLSWETVRDSEGVSRLLEPDDSKTHPPPGVPD